LLWRRWKDFGGHVGFFEVTVFGIEDDLAADEEEDVEFELRTEADGEPDGTGLVGWLRSVKDGEAEARDVGSEEQAHAEGNLAT
jgi:hypothetical protein